MILCCLAAKIPGTMLLSTVMSAGGPRTGKQGGWTIQGGDSVHDWRRQLLGVRVAHNMGWQGYPTQEHSVWGHRTAIRLTVCRAAGGAGQKEWRVAGSQGNLPLVLALSTLVQSVDMLFGCLEEKYYHCR